MALFNVTVKLSGNDGNAFAIMGLVRNALKKAGATKEQLDQYTMDSMSGDYQNLLRVASRYVNIR